MTEPLEILEPAAPEPPSRPRGGAAKVFAGILLSRLMGVVREGAFARYFGVGPHQDALTGEHGGPDEIW